MSTTSPPDPAGTAAGDPYSRSEYRRLIAWGERIKREAPLIERLLAAAPDRSVIDIGCGTGEHVAWLSTQGARAVGLDASEGMLAQARDHQQKGHGRFVHGDIADALRVLAGEPPFGLALCLGNMLPHLLEDPTLDRFCDRVRDLLLPGGTLLLQILNYRRILDLGLRHLPINIRPGDDGEEIVFIRLMKAAANGRILFFPITLGLNPDAPEPVTMRSAKRVELRAWTAADLTPRFTARGFTCTLLGSFAGEPFDPAASADLILVARR